MPARADLSADVRRIDDDLDHKPRVVDVLNASEYSRAEFRAEWSSWRAAIRTPSASSHSRSRGARCCNGPSNSTRPSRPTPPSRRGPKRRCTRRTRSTTTPGSTAGPTPSSPWASSSGTGPRRGSSTADPGSREPGRSPPLAGPPSFADRAAVSRRPSRPAPASPASTPPSGHRPQTLSLCSLSGFLVWIRRTPERPVASTGRLQ